MLAKDVDFPPCNNYSDYLALKSKLKVRSFPDKGILRDVSAGIDDLVKQGTLEIVVIPYYNERGEPVKDKLEVYVLCGK